MKAGALTVDGIRYVRRTAEDYFAMVDFAMENRPSGQEGPPRVELADLLEPKKRPTESRSGLAGRCGECGKWFARHLLKPRKPRRRDLLACEWCRGLR